MEIKEVQKNKIEKRNVSLSIRTFPSYSKFMKTNDISPSKLFNKALEELMEKK